jgi:hypothetical protein
MVYAKSAWHRKSHIFKESVDLICPVWLGDIKNLFKTVELQFTELLNRSSPALHVQLSHTQLPILYRKLQRILYVWIKKLMAEYITLETVCQLQTRRVKVTFILKRIIPNRHTGILKKICSNLQCFSELKMMSRLLPERVYLTKFIAKPNFTKYLGGPVLNH